MLGDRNIPANQYHILNATLIEFIIQQIQIFYLLNDLKWRCLIEIFEQHNWRTFYVLLIDNKNTHTITWKTSLLMNKVQNDTNNRNSVVPKELLI